MEHVVLLGLSLNLHRFPKHEGAFLMPNGILYNLRRP